MFPECTALGALGRVPALWDGPPSAHLSPRSLLFPSKCSQFGDLPFISCCRGDFCRAKSLHSAGNGQLLPGLERCITSHLVPRAPRPGWLPGQQAIDHSCFSSHGQEGQREKDMITGQKLGGQGGLEETINSSFLSVTGQGTAR